MATKIDRQPVDPRIISKIPEKIREVFKIFYKKGYDLWLVGAGVRSLLLGRKITDPDFTTNATPEQIQKLFEDTFYDNKYGTVGIPFKQGAKTEIFEVTTYRTEGTYSDKRRPDSIKWGKSLTEDLRRRDLTINAIVVGRDGNSGWKELVLVDQFAGMKDLQDGIVRAVGKAEDRFDEDPLRMMRAVRIATQMNFVIEKETLAAIVNKAKLLTKISFERINIELKKILSSRKPADGILMLDQTGLLKFIIGEMESMKRVEQAGHHTFDVWKHAIEALRMCPSKDPIVRLATLLHDVGKPKTAKPRDGKKVTFYGHEVVGARMVKEIAKRLRFSKKEIDKLFTLVRWHMFAYDSHMTDASIRRFIRRVGKDNIANIIALRIGDRKGSGSKTSSWRLREFQDRVGQQLYEPMTVSDLKINGHDVMKLLKLKPGPKIGKIINRLFEEVIEDTNRNSKEYLTKRAKELLRETELVDSRKGVGNST